MAAANETTTSVAPGSLGRPLDDDSTKSPVHSGRLIYAKPQDLPSFPSIGLSEKGSAASAAAALGWTTNTSPELWKPDRSVSASAAAMIAKDYKLGPMWEPVPSQHSTKAALLASQSAMSPKAAKPNVTNSGFSAANLAFKSDRSSSATRTTQAHSLERQKSLLAAKGAMANRQRAKSSPTPFKESYPDEANAATNALSAAARAHGPAHSPAASDIGEKAGSVPYVNMNRQMFTSRPPVKSEVDEQKRADVLHASAVAMAKKMFNQQQKMIDAKKAHESAAAALDQADVHSSVSDDAQPAQLTSLQDVAYKQAQARLAKMHEEHFKDREYQDYYGARNPARRFSIRGKLRRRSSSDGDVIEDRKRSQQIRHQMSLFSNKLSEIDDKKRQKDQDALLAAAQRNVHERLKVMDEKISAETGMVPPSTTSQWELKARAAAQIRSEQRIGQTHGKVDVGAGKYMDQDDIDAIAAARVKPILDDINEKAEEEQARQTEHRLEMEKKKEEEEIEKARQKEIHDINKKLKEQDKQERKEKKAEEKQEAKAKKEEDRAARAEQKRLAKAEKRISSPGDQHTEGRNEPGAVTGTTIALNTAGQPVSIPPPEANSPASPVAAESSPEGPPSKGGVKTWLRNRFSRGSKSADDDKAGDSKSARRSFVGGAALTGAAGSSATSLDNRSASVRAVAMAGRSPRDRDPSLEGTDAELASPISSSSSSGEFFRDEARDSRDRDVGLTPPRPVKSVPLGVSQSPSRDSKFREMV
ncbi:hypothetical protein GGR52DRAFT_87726 [Hypoxylon sp. FL1284]|nr:hypothetical protein GGR52DRAFT_87726 [Hypoxylon sp. FL1284]